MNSESLQSIKDNFDYQLNEKNYSKLDKVKTKRSFLKLRNKDRWMVPPKSECLSNIDSSVSLSVPSISVMTTVVN